MRRAAAGALVLAALAGQAAGQSISPAATPDNGGPYNLHILQGGIGVTRPLQSVITAADAPFTLSGWIRPQTADGMILAIGDSPETCRCLALDQGRPVFYLGTSRVAAPAALVRGAWAHLAVVFDGKAAQLFVDGKAVAQGEARSAPASGRLALAPVIGGKPHFGGDLVGLKVDERALTAPQIAAAAAARPAFDLVQIWHVGQGWQWQNRANTGLWQPQDPWTLPQSTVAPTAPRSQPVPTAAALEKQADGRWQINGWEMIEAPRVSAGGAELSRPGASFPGWLKATVPGTVLQTLVDRGVYPDPYHALNNLAIPESLARQDYWYRTSFDIPAEAAGKRTTIRFNGVNYSSEAWINGQCAGDTRGAFTRGDFTFTPVAGRNTIAIRVSPPPHPGTPHEQSIKGGVGENGGQLAIDGPTFVATEGWDWIPAIRDRNTGLWQTVELLATGTLAIGDPQIVTDLPLPRTDSADIYVRVPVSNPGTAPVRATVEVTVAGATLRRQVEVAPGGTTVEFSPRTDPALTVRNPQLWWPNGYGEPVLHKATISVSDGTGLSDRKDIRFGIREVSYDLGLFTNSGSLNRVQVQTTDGSLAGTRLIDITHGAIKESPTGWAASLTRAGEASPAVVPVTDYAIPEPHLTIRVNGVKIAARGGNWGMDDAMKRVSRARLEPYFRLHREAHLNIIRNWMGTNTEPEFYDLADEYGMMVLNDFWQSTQNFQVEPQDPQLFLANARDTIARYRNHPSIVLWFGRNEGVPYPQLNEGLDDLVFQLDGTRWFTGSSNTVNLQYSGPYNYRAPEGYFTDLATGFSVETGTPSLSTLESIQSYTPLPDQWPLSDTLAYHDWHFAGNGDTRTFMETLARMFGPGTSLPDFERKAQMMNLETHKAMFEGLMAHLWTKNTGRLLWMTHPAWPSNAWQIYSSDYDTHAAYYGTRKATEPLHVQLNLPDNVLSVINTTRDDRPGLTVTTRVTDLAGRELFRRVDPVSAPANRVTPLPAVPLDRLFSADPMVLVSLALHDRTGTPVSENFYWRGKDEAAYRALGAMPQVPLALSMARPQVDGTDRLVRVTIRNTSATPALAAKLTLVDGKGQRILPAYYSDNYLSLLPGETREIAIRYPADRTAPPKVRLRGWNVVETSVGAGAK
ncbi:MAG: glycoside hydrolase family 2 [Novosphingobium sp.]|nr:glycoside hydrolase family 2 [Novosphingobium sp.]